MTTHSTLLRPLPHTASLPVYEPGRPLEEVARELGFADLAELTKLASNENALGPPPMAVEAMRMHADKMHLYPDGGSFYLRADLAAQLGVDPARLIFGNGSNELIEFLGHVFLEPGTNAIMGSEAFVIYALIAKAFRAEDRRIPMPGRVHDLRAMREAVDENTRLLFVANPNNPTGTVVHNDDLRELVERTPPHVLVVLDEAYVELWDENERPPVFDWMKERENFLVLRTFSKVYGLAGLRLGYGIGSPHVIAWLEKFRQPFNTSAMAQFAARAALNDVEYLERSRRLVIDGLDAWQRWAEQRGIEIVPSRANFVLLRTGRGRERFLALQKRGVIVRPVDAYGLPDFLRISIGTASENARAMQALDTVLAEAP
jgi:histidinol-phosphate aminotransferase